ncbi:hypothetical protein BSB_06510 [Bacillus stercoris]|nr:hypothetical protein BSB_06510 [Bacillus stercoris]
MAVPTAPAINTFFTQIPPFDSDSVIYYTLFWNWIYVYKSTKYFILSDVRDETFLKSESYIPLTKEIIRS